MKSSPLLQRSGFWYTFIGAIILVLFFYGMSIEHDRTELTQTKIKLEERTSELVDCEKENSEKLKTIKELGISISTFKKSISEKDELINQKEIFINELQNELIAERNKPPKIITKYQDKIIYQEKPEPYHPYGKGNGMLTIYSECNKCPKIQVTVDGENWGVLNHYFSGQPNCSQDGTISKIVLAGKHYIQGKDGNNRTWSYYTTVTADKCNFWHYSY